MEGYADLTIVEATGKSRAIKVEQIRQLQDIAAVPPIEGQFRVILVFGADTITVSAANSLLKWLEEPPSYLVFILVTDHYYRVLETVRSRCSSFLCQPLARVELTRLLVERENIEPSLAGIAATLSEGCPGRALALLEGAVMAQRRSVLDARRTLASVGLPALPSAAHRILDSGLSLGEALQVLLVLARDRLVASSARGDAGLLINSDLEGLVDAGPSRDIAALLAEAERLTESLALLDHPVLPLSQTALELALWPE